MIKLKNPDIMLGHLITIVVWKFGWNPLKNVGGISHRRNVLYILHMCKKTKGCNSVKNDEIVKPWQYALGHLITIVVWKFGWNPLKNVGVAHRIFFSLYITYVQKKQRAVIPWKMIKLKNPDNMRWGTWLQ